MCEDQLDQLEGFLKGREECHCICVNTKGRIKVDNTREGLERGTPYHELAKTPTLLYCELQKGIPLQAPPAMDRRFADMSSLDERLDT